MPSLPVPATTRTTPEQWSTRPFKSRTAAQRRVYGKRRANAPRAVFDQGTPVKRCEDVVADALDDVQVRLADIKIQDEPTRAGESVDAGSTAEPTVVNNLDTLESGQRDRDMHTDSLYSEGAPRRTEESNTGVEVEHEGNHATSPMRSKLKASQRMLEVRITPRLVTSSRRRNDESANATETNRTIRKTPARLSSGCVNNEKAAAYARPILDEAISPLAAQGVQKFSSWAARGRNMFEVVKLAEGSYGEVYKLRLREEACKKKLSKTNLTRLREYDRGVFKIVPLRPQRGPRSRKFTSVDEIVSETKMLKHLDPIPGFARFRDIHVVQGRFPESFQAAWNHYKQTKDDCLNPDPSNKAAYPDSQMWAIVEMDDAGRELEKFSWSSIFQIYDIFWGVAMALARAEEYAMFEHRDLHLGNICIRTSRPNGCLDPPSDVDITPQSCSGFGLSTLETTIIDYSLSRAEVQTGELNGDQEVASSNLDRKQIFDAIGQDEDEVLLRNTYRHMRAEVYTGNPMATEKTPDVDGIWGEYAPRTNLIWLLFLLKILLNNRKDPSQRKPLATCSPNQNVQKKRGRPKKGAEKGLVKQAHSNEAQSHVIRLKKTLEERLTAVLDLLDLEHGHEDMCCAADLVAFAIDSRWLDEKDFF